MAYTIFVHKHKKCFETVHRAKHNSLEFPKKCVVFFYQIPPLTCPISKHNCCPSHGIPVSKSSLMKCESVRNTIKCDRGVFKKTDSTALLSFMWKIRALAY